MDPTLEMFGELPQVADVLLFSGEPIIFEVDVLLELGKRRIVIHSAGKMPSSEGVRPAKSHAMRDALDVSCRVAAQFNHALQRTAA